MVRLEHAAAVTSSAGLRTNLGGDDRPVRAGRRLHHRRARTAARTDGSVHAVATRCGRRERAVAGHRRSPASTRCSSTSTARPTTARPPGSTTPASCCRCSACRRNPPRARPPTRCRDVVRARHLASRCASPCCGRWPTGPGWPRARPAAPRPVRLIDDDLATSLAPGGRLDTLLSAVDFATSPTVDPGGQVRSALCLAVDPDLLVTVNAMTAGYVVNDDPDDGPDYADASRHRAGRGDRLAGSAQGAGPAACASRPTTYAQADLDALQRVGDPGLSSIATNGAADIVDQILGITSTRGATLRRRRAADRPRRRPARRAGPDGRDRRRRPHRAGLRPTRRARPPPTLTTACGTRRRWSPPRSTRPSARRWRARAPIRRSPSYLDPVARRSASSTTRRSRAARTPWARCCGAGCSPRREPRTQILMPPLVWRPAGRRRRRPILTTVATTIHAGLAVPRPLTAVIAESDAVPPQDLAAAARRAAPANPRAHFDDARHRRHRGTDRQAVGADRGADRPTSAPG